MAPAIDLDQARALRSHHDFAVARPILEVDRVQCAAGVLDQPLCCLGLGVDRHHSCAGRRGHWSVKGNGDCGLSRGAHQSRQTASRCAAACHTARPSSSCGIRPLTPGQPRTCSRGEVRPEGRQRWMGTVLVRAHSVPLRNSWMHTAASEAPIMRCEFMSK